MKRFSGESALDLGEHWYASQNFKSLFASAAEANFICDLWSA